VDRTGRHWTTEPPALHRRQVQDIIRQQPGVTVEGRKYSIKEVFQLYLTQEIQSVIIRETNREAERCYGEWNSSHPDNQKCGKEFDWIECEALLVSCYLLVSTEAVRSHLKNCGPENMVDQSLSPP
jgi:hypothetical protein